MKVALLSGGVGGARFARGLVRAVDPRDVTVIGNVGDDLEVLGLSCITNAAAGVFPEPLHHDEVMETARQVKGQFIALLEGIIGRL